MQYIKMKHCVRCNINMVPVCLVHTISVISEVVTIPLATLDAAGGGKAMTASALT
jgi:hypothetical protein